MLTKRVHMQNFSGACKWDMQYQTCQMSQISQAAFVYNFGVWGKVFHILGFLDKFYVEICANWDKIREKWVNLQIFLGLIFLSENTIA